jgi:hypothetical protein
MIRKLWTQFYKWTRYSLKGGSAYDTVLRQVKHRFAHPHDWPGVTRDDIGHFDPITLYYWWGGAQHRLLRADEPVTNVFGRVDAGVREQLYRFRSGQ